MIPHCSHPTHSAKCASSHFRLLSPICCCCAPVSKAAELQRVKYAMLITKLEEMNRLHREVVRTSIACDTRGPERDCPASVLWRRWEIPTSLLMPSHAYLCVCVLCVRVVLCVCVS